MRFLKKLLVSDKQKEDGADQPGVYNTTQVSDESDKAAIPHHQSHSHTSQCPSLGLIVSCFYGVLCLTYSLVMRLYLQAFYCSAYIAGWSVMAAIFVIFHHIGMFHGTLGCSKMGFSTFQIVVDTFLMVCCVVMGAGYTAITAISIHINFDYAIAAALSFANGLVMFYLLVKSSIAARGARFSMYSVNNGSFVWTTQHDRQDGASYEMQELPSNGHMVTGNGAANGNMAVNGDTVDFRKSDSENSTLGKCCQKLCKGLSCCLVSVVYYPVIIVMVVTMTLSTCYPYFVLSDTLTYRENESMYTVQVEGHLPLALFMKCRGTGATTLVYENGLGGVAYMQWDFIPQMLQQNYTICVHDRRGYGWSEGYQHDQFNLLWQEPQWSKINSEFFVQLVEKANISTPFYYVGHSYGGSHLMYTFRQRPDIIKGLIFLDSIELDAAQTFRHLLGILVNFQPTGLLYIMLKTGLLDYTKAFETVGDFSSVSQHTSELMISAMRSGTYFESYLREWGPLRDNDSPYHTHPHIISAMSVNKPTLVIDRDGRNSSWFPSSNFTRFNDSFYSQVPGTSHTTLVYSEMLARVTAKLIDNFIQYSEESISFNQYLNNRKYIITSDRNDINNDFSNDVISDNIDGEEVGSGEIYLLRNSTVSSNFFE